MLGSRVTIVLLSALMKKAKLIERDGSCQFILDLSTYTSASRLSNKSSLSLFVSSFLDSISRGYNSGHGGLSSSKRPFPPHADLLETCDFLREIGPSHRKSLDFEKRSTYSVSLLSEDRGVYHSRFSLPHGCIYLAWFGCLSTAFTAALFTIWYGVR